jgi:VWFA-related protein
MRYGVAGVIVLLGMLSAAPQAGQTTQTFVAGVDLVQVDVSVLDKNRRPVRGLQATDFTLFVDGKPRPVAEFAPVNLPPRAPTPATHWMRDMPLDVASNDLPDDGRLLIVLMDRSIPIGLPALTAHNVAKAAIEQLGPGDLAAVVYTGAGTSQDFTNDRARLLAAIGDNPAAGLQQETTERWEIQKDQLEAAMWEPPDPSAPKPPRILPSDASGECYCGLCVLDSIKTIADAVRDLQGRKKSLLFIGADIITDTKDPRCESAVIDAREAMFTSMDLANVTVHAFDANGLETNVVAASASPAGVISPISPRPGAQTLPVARSQQLLTRQGHLAILPDCTGGRTVLNTNNPEGRVPDILRESESYYLLGFEPSAADGRAHTISVRVDRPDVQVRSRRAYLANPAVGATSTAPVPPAIRAIASVIPARHGITLMANALALAAPNTHDPVVILALHAQNQASKEPLTARPEPVDVVTAVFTADGRPVGTFRQTVEVTPAEAPGAATTYDVVQRLPAKPGRYELRIAVNDAARNQSGSVYAFVDIPAFGKTPFAWSDIGISAAAAKPAMKGTMADVVPARPIARRDFDRQEHVTAFISGYHVSGALPAPIEIVSRIVDDENHKKFEQKASLSAGDFGASQSASYQMDIPLSTLEPGAYLLTMETRAGKGKTTRYVRFSVR